MGCQELNVQLSAFQTMAFQAILTTQGAHGMSSFDARAIQCLAIWMGTLESRLQIYMPAQADWFSWELDIIGSLHRNR